jgi:hypothetical protein
MAAHSEASLGHRKPLHRQSAPRQTDVAPANRDDTARETAAHRSRSLSPTTVAINNPSVNKDASTARRGIQAHIQWAKRLTSKDPISAQQPAARRALPPKSILRKATRPAKLPATDTPKRTRMRTPPPPDSDPESGTGGEEPSGSEEEQGQPTEECIRMPDDTIVKTCPLPLIGEPPTFDREIQLPVAADFVWPKATHFCMYEHNGAFTLALFELLKGGIISVANRRCTRPPPPNCYHFIGTVQEFVEAYPYPLGMVISHVTCAPAAAAATLKLPERIRDGSFKETALEILWCLHLGTCAAAEQPATNLHYVLGPPTFVTNATRHGGRRHKVFTWWLRGLDKVPDGEETPINLLLPRLSGSNAETRMLRRTETPLSLARSHARAWNVDVWANAETDRPANALSSGYAAALAELEERYGIFAAGFAPHVSSQLANSEKRSERYAFVVPIAHDGEHLAMVRLDGGSFAVTIENGESATDAVSRLKPFLPCEADDHQLFARRAASNDAVIAFPNATKPTQTLRTQTAYLEAVNSGTKVAWCTLDAISEQPTMQIAAEALMRAHGMAGTSPFSGFKVGCWNAPKPIVKCRASRRYEIAEASPEASAQWARFLQLERARAKELKQAYKEQGEATLPFVDVVISAADKADELPMPDQGFPCYSDASMGRVTYPEPPAPLLLEWINITPPQQLPPGYENLELPITKLLRRAYRNDMVEALNMTVAHDWECVVSGNSNLPRHEYKAYGDECFCMLPHLDGIGHFRANEILWKRHPNGLYRPLRFEDMGRDHKRWDMIKKHIGATTDQELLSFLFHGVNWKVDAPRQMRIGRNVESLKTRAVKVGRSTAKLIKTGLWECTKLAKAGALVSPEDAFAHCIPGYSVGVGGQDKPDNPSECRKTSDSTAPIWDETNPVRTTIGLGQKQGPDPKLGEVVINFNDLTGPKKIPEGFTGHASFPDPETKSTPRDRMKALAVVSHIAYLLDSHVSGFKDDVRWMFWQFMLEWSQLWLNGEYLFVPFDVKDEEGNVIGEEWWFCSLLPLVMNMGTRPASKIACRFSENELRAWRSSMRAYVRVEWLPKAPPVVQNLLAAREATLGEGQGDPFCALLYTDDFDFFFPCTQLNAVGLKIWRQQVNDQNVWMSQKVGAGTIIDSIGGRFVLNGGFSCLVPNKKTRCSQECIKALSSEGITRDELVANNSFIVHVDDLINLPPGSRAGIWAPTKGPGFGTDRVHLNATKENGEKLWTHAAASYERIITALEQRPYASFHCAIPDAPTPDTWAAKCIMSERATSDACTNPKSGRPHVYGQLNGVFWKYPIDGEWRLKHINITESLGPFGNLLTFGVASARGNTPLILGTDNTSAAACMLGTAKSIDLITVAAIGRKAPEYEEAAANAWVEHEGGYNNIITDLGSRDELEKQAIVAAAYGSTLKETTPPPSFFAMAEQILHNTSNYYDEPPDPNTPEEQPAPPQWNRCRCRRGCFTLCKPGQRFCNGCGANIRCTCTCAGCKQQPDRAEPGDVYNDDEESEVPQPEASAENHKQLEAIDNGNDTGNHGSPDILADILFDLQSACDVSEESGNMTDHTVQEDIWSQHYMEPTIHGAEPAAAGPQATRKRRRNPEEVGLGSEASSIQRSSASFLAKEGATPDMFIRRAPASPLEPIRPPRWEPRASASERSDTTRRRQHNSTTPPMLPIAEQSPLRPTRSRQQSELAAIGDSEAAGCGASTANLVGSPDRSKTEKLRSSQPPTPDIFERSNTDAPLTMAGSTAAHGADVQWTSQHSQQALTLDDESTGPVPEMFGHRGLDKEHGRSPQPTSAATARKLAAAELADRLSSDTSAYAICPGQPERIKHMVVSAADARLAAIPHGTSSNDAWGFSWAMKFGLEHDTPWMRPRREHVRPEDEPRETHFCVLLLIWMATMMKPSARTKAKGFDQAKPDSPMQALYAYRRVLRDCGRFLACLAMVLIQLKALRKQYTRTFGDLALVKQQQQPLSKHQQLAMLRVLTTYAMDNWSVERHDGMLMYFMIAVNLAVRNDEQSHTPGGTFLKRANFVPIDADGNALTVTPETVKKWAHNGAMLRGRSVGSKCDPTNSHWGSRDMWFVYDDTNVLSLAVAWARHEIRYPCPPENRQVWPAASQSCNDKPYTIASAAEDHKRMCIQALGEEGKDITPHAHRVTLATAVMAQPDGEEPVAQALVRHKTVEALRTYYKMLPSKYADMVNRATRTDAAKHSNLTIPEIDPSGPAERIDATISELESETAAATRKGQGSSSGPAAAAAGPRRPTTTQYIIGEKHDSTPVYIKADAEDDPHGVIGVKVSLPYELWPNFRRCGAKCTKKQMCAKCKLATKRAPCTIVAFAENEGMYILNDEGQHYAFQYNQIYNHFTRNTKMRIQTGGKQPLGKRAHPSQAPSSGERARTSRK